MPEHSENAAADLMGNIMETIAENLPRQKSVRFDDGDGSSISEQAKKLFGGGESRKKSVHHVLGGGKCTYRIAICTARPRPSWVFLASSAPSSNGCKFRPPAC